MSAVLRHDLLRARSRSFARLEARALALIERAATACDGRLYVAFSGGKDSLVALALASRVLPGITALWTDDELEHDEQITSIPAAASALGVPLVVKTGTQLHAGWFRSWRDEPFWREPLPGTVVTDLRARTLMQLRGYQGVVLGLRAQEAAHRRRYLAAKGRLHDTVDSGWRCNPLAGWTVDDVWALIARDALPVSPVYDVLARIGVPRAEQRVGPLPLAQGWQLRQGWPELAARLVARYGRMWGGM